MTTEDRQPEDQNQKRPNQNWTYDELAEFILYNAHDGWLLSRKSNAIHHKNGGGYDAISEKLKSEGNPHSLRSIRKVLEDHLLQYPDPQKRLPALETIRRDLFTFRTFPLDDLNGYESHLDALKDSDYFPSNQDGIRYFDDEEEDRKDMGVGRDDDESDWTEDDDSEVDEEKADVDDDEKQQPTKLPFPNKDEQEQMLDNLKNGRAKSLKREADAAKVTDVVNEAQATQATTESNVLDVLRGNAQAIGNLRQVIRELIVQRPEYSIDLRQSLLTLQEQIELLLGDLPSA